MNFKENYKLYVKLPINRIAAGMLIFDTIPVYLFSIPFDVTFALFVKNHMILLRMGGNRSES